jgi:hypothetical protein
LKEISAAQLVFSCVGQLEISSIARERELKEIVRAGPVVELNETAGAFAAIVKPCRLRRIQEAIALKGLSK